MSMLMIRWFLSLSLMLYFLTLSARAQNNFEQVLAIHIDDIIKPSSRTVEPVLADIVALQYPEGSRFLIQWQEKAIWYVKETQALITVTPNDDDTFSALAFPSGVDLGIFNKRDIKQIKPNSGVRGRIDAALVGVRLMSNDPAERQLALEAIARNGL